MKMKRLNPARRGGWAWALLSILLVCAGAEAETLSDPAESLCIYTVKPAVFDYVLTAAFEGADGDVRLTFNDRFGRTHFVRPGDRLGTGAVESYDAESDTAILRDARGDRIELERGAYREEPGYMARVMAPESGASWLVKEGEIFDHAGHRIRVTAIGSHSVSVAVSGRETALAAATEEDMAAFSRVRREREEAWAERIAREKEAVLEARRRRDEGVGLVVRSKPLTGETLDRDLGFSVGREYRYPTRYDIVPPVYRDGKVVSPGFAVPTDFETRVCGSGIDGRVGGIFRERHIRRRSSGLNLSLSYEGDRFRGSVRW